MNRSALSVFNKFYYDRQGFFDNLGLVQGFSSQLNNVSFISDP